MQKRKKKIIDLRTREGRQLFYNSPEWLAIRRVVLTKNPFCVECIKESIYKVSEEVDHIIPLKDAPERCLDINNLQALCKNHHSRKTFLENIESNTFCNRPVFTQKNMKWKNLKIN